MKFNYIRYNFENVFQREISQIAQLFGKLRDLRYLSRFFSYKCFLIFKKCQSSFFVWKFHLIRKNLKSDKTISNRAATARFEIFLTQKLFAIFSCILKMAMMNMHFLVKTISILSKYNKFYLKSRSEKPCCAIWNIGSRMQKLDFYSVMP